MRIPNNDEMTALEQLIDACGLDEVLIAVSVICGDKAAHIRASYSDCQTARVWDLAGKAAQRAAESGSVSAVSR